MSATSVGVRGCRTMYRLSYLSQRPTLLTKLDARAITKICTPQRQFLTQLFGPSSYRHLQQIGKGAQLHTSRLQPATGMIRTMFTRLRDQLSRNSGRLNSKGSDKGGDGQWSAIGKAARQKKHHPNAKFQDKSGKDGPGGGGSGPRSSPPFSPGDLITGLGVLMLIDFLVASNTNSKAGQRDVSMQFFLQNMLAVGEVDRIEVDKDNECAFISLHKDAVIEGIDIAPSRNIYRISLGSIATFEHQLEEFQQELGLNETDFIGVRYINNGGSNFLSELFFALIPVAIFVGIFALSRRSSSGGSSKSGSEGVRDMFQVGKIKADARALPSATRFKDVAGLTEAKVEVMEFVEYLKNPAQFETLGARVPKGALLTGPPGTGKTLLAKAVAGEAQVPFFAVSGSDFVEMFVGVGASRVRDLFKKARESKPAIIYIDEIDAVGKARSSGEGGNQERETTLNQLLVEMDGFNTETGIIILASTNRADTLDKALLRPGRFDRQIECDLPSLPERKEIFEVHLKPITMDEKGKTKLINQLSALTPGMSGAQIANVCNEAALHAARRGAKQVEQIDFASAADRVIAGSEKKSRAMSHKELEVVAYHESGHVLTAWLIDSAAPLLKTTIIPRTNGALGFAQYMPSEKLLFSSQELENQLVVLLGGRAAEMHKFGSITTGAQDDLQRVTQMAYAMLTQYGMSSSIGNLSFPDFPKPEQGKRSTSNALAESVEREVDKVVRRAYLRAETILSENSDHLTKLAQELLKKETLTYDDVEGIIGKRPFPHVHPYKIVDVPPLAGEDEEGLVNGESSADTNTNTNTDTDTDTNTPPPPPPGEPTPAI